MESNTIKALQIQSFNSKIEVSEVPMPVAGKDEVLVKMAYSPINPSDVLNSMGHYPSGQTPPCTLGFEGSGIIESVGQDCLVQHKVGDRVSILGLGIWSQYVVTKSEMAFAVHPSNSLEQAAAHYINPVTVLCFLDIVEKSGSRALIHSAGASALGKMLIKICKAEGIKTINLVRKKIYFDELTSLGSDLNLDITDPNFETDLAKAATEFNAVTAFDAVGGDLTAKIIHAMPNGSSVYCYGVLSSVFVNNLPIADLLFQGKEVKGLWLVTYLQKLSQQEQIAMIKKAQANLSTTLETKFKVFDFTDIDKALDYHKTNSSNLKSLLKF